MNTELELTTKSAAPQAATLDHLYDHVETRELVALVEDAAALVAAEGEGSFEKFRTPDSRWRQGERYVFVLSPDGFMHVHPDPELEGKSDLDLKDVNGKPIIRGLIRTATATPGRSEGWYHYQWAVPGGLFPRWKSSYVRLVQAPSGEGYVVGSGMYDDRMERAFVVDIVRSAVAEIEAGGEAAFDLLRDPTGPFLVKDTYVFVHDMNLLGLVNPAFPSLEGRNLMDVRDTHGRYVNREMVDVVRTSGSGWVDYMWPKPGESESTLKSAYVSRARIGDRALVVGCGVYLADAPKEAHPGARMTAPALIELVREAAAVLEERGERAYPDLRRKGSKWFRDDTYFFVFTMDGRRAFHAAQPETEGRDDSGLEDIHGRPIGRMILALGATPSGEGWIHYMYPEPESRFPAWKSTFVKRVTYPSRTPHLVGCGIYNMRMDRAFIEDVVDRASSLVAERGRGAFDELRDRKGPFVFMDTYVFVHDDRGTELVNPMQPVLEGRNLLELRDVTGKTVIRDQIAAASRDGSAWLDCYWYQPGNNAPARKQTYVRKVESEGETFFVGSGIYVG
jgi:signal transduction histidine kinase